MISMLPFLLIFRNECNAALPENYGYQFKLLRGNATLYTVEEIKKELQLEYPKTEEIFQQVQNMWKTYYSCLKMKSTENEKPQIIRLLEGQFTEFQCDVCRKPFYDYQDLEWKYRPVSTQVNITEPEHLDLSPEMMLTTIKTLKIFNAIEDFSGLYVCYQGKNLISAYILEVSANDTIQKVNHSSDQNKITLNSEGIDIQIYYKWNEWTECSLCGNVGRKFKYGSCFVSVSKVKHMSDQKVMNILRAKENLKYNDNFIKISFSNMDFKNRRALEILEKFESGIPCASPFLPRVLQERAQEFPAVKVEVTRCLVTCDESEIFVVLDKCGRVIEVANNTAGIYSAFQDLPYLTSDTERTSVTGEFGKDIILRCPGSLLTTTPITWKINEKVIFPEIIANESNGRFTIDFVNRIHIKKLRSKDSRIYSCWQRDKLAGTVYLIVDKKFKISLNHHVVLIGMMILVAIVLFIVVNVA